MIHDIEIHTMDDLFRMVSEQEYREDLGRNRDLFVYRGELPRRTGCFFYALYEPEAELQR